MRYKAIRHRFPLVVAGILILPTILSAQQNLSHVRVVRLSYVSGTVGVKRPGSTEWAKALVNTPIQEGFEVSTAASSYAEVEFENGSTARLGEFSKVNFDQLAMDQDGNKLNRLTFEQGYATFHFLPEHQDAYGVKIADATLTPNGKSEFRTDLEPSRVRVEVFSGSIDVAASTQTVKLGKDKVLEFDPQATQLALNAKPGIVKDSWDKWTSDRDTQSQLSLADQAVSARGPLYGWSDLNAYGEWGYFPGFGYGWSPYASMGWSPYSMGMWSMYPGMGYTWISSEPWGWLPYHYGGWDFNPDFGWFWMPGMMGSYWSPALVSMYSGPGWIGWVPRGVSGPRMLTTVPSNVVQQGLAIDSQNVNRVPAKEGTLISRLPFEPGAGPMLSGTRLSNAATLFTPHAGATHSTAPASILMGVDSEKEQSLYGQRLAHQPLRARMGTTLGGHYAVGGTTGEFRGNAIKGAEGLKGAYGSEGPRYSRGGAGGPVILSHGQQSSASSRGGGGPTMSGGGGTTSSVSSSTMNSSPAPVSSVSSGHSASSGGGHH